MRNVGGLMWHVFTGKQLIARFRNDISGIGDKGEG